MECPTEIKDKPIEDLPRGENNPHLGKPAYVSGSEVNQMICKPCFMQSCDPVESDPPECDACD